MVETPLNFLKDKSNTHHLPHQPITLRINALIITIQPTFLKNWTI